MTVTDGRPIRLGVIGVGRGMSFARASLAATGMELVALCDKDEKRLAEAAGSLGVATYTDYDRFLEHDFDAVVLANYFYEHAPFAIKALEAGKHVMSETSACFTVAQGVALIEAVERSGCTYMFAENYPYMVFNQEMRRLFQAGKVGTFTYGEGEYVHPMSADDRLRISPGLAHWRNWIPATYYCTHALAPLMCITDTWPTMVNGFIMPYPKDDPVAQRSPRAGDAASVIMLRMNNGAVVKLLQVYLRGHGVWVRVHGSRGQMENLRHGNTRMVRLRREQYHEERVDPEEQIYLPDFPEHHAEAMATGHGGGDYFMLLRFGEAIRSGQQPYLDVYRGVTMSIVGILAYRSALDNSNTIVIPNLSDPAERDRYREDHWNPNPLERTIDSPWPSIEGQIKNTKQQLDYARSVWDKMGVD